MPKKANSDKRANSKKLKAKRKASTKAKDPEVAIPTIEPLTKEEQEEFYNPKTPDPLMVLAQAMKTMAENNQKTVEALTKINEKLDTSQTTEIAQTTSIDEARQNLVNSEPLFYGKIFKISYLKHDLSHNDWGQERGQDPDQFETEQAATEHWFKKYWTGKFRIYYISVAQSKNKKPDTKKFIRTL